MRHKEIYKPDSAYIKSLPRYYRLGNYAHMISSYDKKIDMYEGMSIILEGDKIVRKFIYRKFGQDHFDFIIKYEEKEVLPYFAKLALLEKT